MTRCLLAPIAAESVLRDGLPGLHRQHEAVAHRAGAAERGMPVVPEHVEADEPGQEDVDCQGDGMAVAREREEDGRARDDDGGD